MGISWSLISVSEVLANKDAYDYFKDTNIEIPSSADNARFPPTLREIRMVLDSLESEGYETIYNIPENYWRAWISNRILLGFEPQTTQEMAEGIVNAMRSPQVQIDTEKRESLLAGPSGKFIKIQSSWEVMADGTRRLLSFQPFGAKK